MARLSAAMIANVCTIIDAQQWLRPRKAAAFPPTMIDSVPAMAPLHRPIPGIEHIDIQYSRRAAISPRY